ncbi:MAG: peptidylprolyl isomerase [Bacteroidaceae bacterium]
MKQNSTVKYLVLFILLLTGANVWAQDNVIDEVVWVVGDKPIFKSDIEEARMNAQYEGRKFKGDPNCVIAEELAIQKLYLHQAELDSVYASESDITRRLDMMTNRYIQMIGSKEKMEEYFNKNWSQIRDDMRENIRNTLTVQQMQQQLVGDIKVTPSEVRRYFETIPKDSLPYVPTMVEVRVIKKLPHIPQTEIDEVKRELREYSDRINKGESDFSTLALLYSEDKGSAMNGGEIGFKGRGELVPAYSTVAFNLRDTKKVSKIVKSEFGYHVIQLIERRGDRINTRHILLKPKIPATEIDSAEVKLDSIAKDIRSGKFTFEKAALYLSDDESTRNNGGLMPNSETTTSKFEMQQLPQEIAKMVDGMKVGEISDAFEMINQKDGQTECAIVQLKERTDGHKAIITEDYQNLKQIVENKRREELLDKWIQEKQKKTYVRISENGRKCAFRYPGWIK